MDGMADITKLIRIYRANECLWNHQSPAYHNLALRESAWRRIAYLFQDSLTIDQLKTRMRKLKRYYVDECLAIQSNQMKGYSYVPRYSFFKDLCFLPSMSSHHSANEIVGISAKCPVDPLSHARSEQQMRTKMRNDQINCIIEDALLPDSSRERIPSVNVDFRTKPAYRFHKPSLNQADHEFGSHDSLQAKFEDGEQGNYTFCKQILNKAQIQNQTMDENGRRLYKRAESGTDGKNNVDEDEWKDFTNNLESNGGRSGDSWNRSNLDRSYNQSDATILNQRDCEQCRRDSQNEISDSSSRWKYGSNNDPKSNYNYPNHTPSVMHANTIRSSFNSAPSWRYEDDKWSQDKENYNKSSNCFNSKAIVLCGQSKPKKYLASCKLSSRMGKSYEKHWSGHRRRHNQVSSHRLKRELALQRQNYDESYDCRHGKQFEGYILRQSRRRSSGAEKHGSRVESNPHSDNYREAEAPTEIIECPYYNSRKRKPKGTWPPLYMELPVQQSPDVSLNCQCPENFNEPDIEPCPVHHNTFDQQQSKYTQYTPSEQENYPLYLGNSPQKENQPQYKNSQQFGNPPRNENPTQYGNSPQYEKLPQYGNSPQSENSPQYGNPPNQPLEKAPTAASITAQSYSAFEPQQIVEHPKEPEILMEKPCIYPTNHHPEYIPCPSFKDGNLSVYVPCPSLRDVCPAAKQRHERDGYEERERESPRSRHEYHQNVPEMDNEMDYAQYRYYKDRIQRRHSDDYRGERESPRRREKDYKYIECPAFRPRSSRRRHSNENVSTYTGRSSAKQNSYEQRPHRERKRKEEESDDEYDPGFGRHRKQVQQQRNQSLEQTCGKMECPAVKRYRQEQIAKKAAEEFKRRNRRKQITSSKGHSSGRSENHRGIPSDMDDLEMEIECACESDSDPDNRYKRKSENKRIKRKGKSSPSDYERKNRRGMPSDLDDFEMDIECVCESESDRDKREQRKSEDKRRSKKVKSPTKNQPSDFEKKHQRDMTDLEMEIESDTDKHMSKKEKYVKRHPSSDFEDEESPKQKQEPFPSKKSPVMCEVAVETDIDMSLRGRNSAKPQNRYTQLNCCCSFDKVVSQENIQLCDCDKEPYTKCTMPRGHGGLSEKPAKSSKRTSQKANNNNVPTRSGAGKTATNSNNPGNKKRQRFGCEALPKWNNGLSCQPVQPRVAKPVVLKSFRIPPIVAKATMGIINNHISNFNELLQNQQCIANKPVVRCLRRKPIPKPSRRNQLSEDKAVPLTNNPLKSINFNASKREVIILHPPVKDFRPSKNSFDVEVKHLQGATAEQVEGGSQTRSPPKPPAVKPKRIVR